MVDDSRQGHVGRFDIDATAHAVVDAVRLFENFLQHEMRITTLLQLSEVHFDGLHLRLHLHIIQVNHFQFLTATHDSNLVVLQINHLVRVFDNRCGVGTKEEFILPDSHHQRTALPCHQNGVRLTTVEQRNGIRSNHLMQGQLQGGQQIELVGELDILNQLHQHFRVGIAQEGNTLLLKPFLQRRVVLDNAVMNQCQIAR